MDVATAVGGSFAGGAANPVEDFSSDGPRKLFFHPNGAAITPGNFLFGTGGGITLAKVARYDADKARWRELKSIADTNAAGNAPRSHPTAIGSNGSASAAPKK